MKYLKRFVLIAAFFSIQSIQTSLVFAYVPPTFYIAKSLSSAHAGFQKLKIKSKITVFDGNGEGQLHLNETMYFTGKNASSVTVRMEDEHLSEINTYYRKISENSRSLVYDLLFAKEEKEIFTNLVNLGLPLKPEAEIYKNQQQAQEMDPPNQLLDEKAVELELQKTKPHLIEEDTFFVRYNGRAVQELSDSDGQIKLFIEKFRPEKVDSMKIAGLLWKDPKDNTGSSGGLSSIEYRFHSYNNYGGDEASFAYPASIDILRDGVLWVSIETKEVNMTEDLAPPKSTKKAGFSSLGSQARSFLDSYFKWVR